MLFSLGLILLIAFLTLWFLFLQYSANMSFIFILWGLWGFFFVCLFFTKIVRNSISEPITFGFMSNCDKFYLIDILLVRFCLLMELHWNLNLCKIVQKRFQFSVIKKTLFTDYIYQRAIITFYFYVPLAKVILIFCIFKQLSKILECKM